MGWDSALKERLNAATGLPLDVAVRVSRNAGGGGVGDNFLIASDLRLQPGCYLDPKSLSVQSSGVSVPDFRYQAGGFSVEFNLPVSYSLIRGSSSLMPSVRRGAICELLIGFGGGDINGYIPYKLGVISNIKILSTSRARLEVYDIVYALRSRPTPALSAGGDPQTQLFHGVAGTETTLSTNYTAGDTTVTLTDETNFETFDGSGVAKLEGNSGDMFYVKFTGVNTGANQLTGVTGNHFDTTDEDATSGNAAVSCAYINTHPITAIWRLLVSTGTGNNGSQDRYPETAGFGLDQYWIDWPAMRAWTSQVLVPSSGSYNIDLLIEEPVEDGLHFIGALFAELGIWVVQSEGLLSIRAAQDPDNPSIEHPFAINDGMLIDFPTVDLYDPSVPFSHNRVEVKTYSGETGTGRDASVLPLRDLLTFDASSFIRSNEGPIRTEARDRLDDYGLYVPERVSLSIRGAFTGLTPGDLIRITSSQIRSRFASSHEGYVDRTAFVALVHEDPIGGTTDLEVLVYPLSAADDYA